MGSPLERFQLDGVRQVLGVSAVSVHGRVARVDRTGAGSVDRPRLPEKTTPYGCGSKPGGPGLTTEHEQNGLPFSTMRCWGRGSLVECTVKKAKEECRVSGSFYSATTRCLPLASHHPVTLVLEVDFSFSFSHRFVL